MIFTRIMMWTLDDEPPGYIDWVNVGRCETCGALVLDDDLWDKHAAWHSMHQE